MAGRPRNPKHIVPAADVIRPDQMLQEKLTLETLLPAILEPKDAIRWLAKRSLLRNDILCHVCGDHMTLHSADGADRIRWSCPGKCKRSKSIRDGSWFENSKISLTDNILLLYFWHMDITQVQVARELKCSATTIVDWMNFIREVCEEDLRLHSQQTGGLDEQTGLPITEEIDHELLWRNRYRNDENYYFSRLLTCIREQY